MKTILVYKDGSFMCIDRNSLFEYWDDSVQGEYPFDYCKNVIETNIKVIKKLQDEIELMNLYIEGLNRGN
jgi:hypothetical protein